MGRPYRILLVEDDRADVMLVEALLEDTLPGATLIWHPHVPSADEVDAAHPDCVLVDLGLPGMTGLDALHAMVELVENAPVIVLTGLDDRPTGLSAVARGAADFLVKGADDGESLARAIRYAVERSHAAVARTLWREAELLRAENLRLERGLLPRPLLNDERLVWRALYRPGAGTSVLGGDFFDTVERPDGSLRMVIGDVSGHGPDEAALGVCLRIAWRTLVLAGIPDADVLPGLDDVLMAERQNHQFCTVCDLTISPDRRRIGTRIAGHPPPVLFGERPVFLGSEHRGVPLGVRSSLGWDTATVSVDDAWGVLLFTDGVFEPLLADGSRLELEGLLDLVGQRPVPRHREDLDAMLDHLQQPHERSGHRDDIAMVGLLVTP